MMQLPDLPRRAWEHIVLRTLAFIAGVVCVSVVVTHIMLLAFAAEPGAAELMVSAIMPAVLGAPVVFFFLLKNRELEYAYRRLEAAAAHDSLTGCLNHGAFAERVNAMLSGGRNNPRGALLVVDADHFKSINDRFGHAHGDVALARIAAAIRSAVRKGDVVGRIGGEEFGVFLPGARRERAAAAAEAIRRAVQASSLRIEGRACPLSVSVGGAVFEAPIGFGELFRCADKRLYNVKNSGRNNVDLAAFGIDGDREPAVLARTG